MNDRVLCDYPGYKAHHWLYWIVIDFNGSGKDVQVREGRTKVAETERGRNEERKNEGRQMACSAAKFIFRRLKYIGQWERTHLRET